VSRCIVVMQDSLVVGKKFGSFPSNFITQPFQYFQIVNLVDCLSSWYKFIMYNPSNISSQTLFSVHVHIVVFYAVEPRNLVNGH